MAAIQPYEPAIFIPEGMKAPQERPLPPGAGHTGTAVIQRADIVTLAAGVLSRAATNSNANFAGYAQHSEAAVFNGSNAAPYENQQFGFSQVGTLLPNEPLCIHVQPLQGLYLEMSCTASTGWVTGGTQQVNYGSTGGLLLDPTTNLFFFDPTQVNKPLTIYSKPQGPNKGWNGDTGIRVLVYFNAGLV